MNRYFRAEISENRQIRKGYNLLSVSPLLDFKDPEPGQFFMFGIGSGHNPLLRRPFSFFRKTGNGFQILYRVSGQGTTVLKDMREGSAIDVIGPLGNAYPVPAARETPLLVAGGIGMASLFSYAEKFPEAVYFFYGAKTFDELLFIDELAENSCALYTCTDDGSYGEKGSIVEVFRKFLKYPLTRIARPVVYSCGPRKMLEAVSKIAEDKRLTAYISMEENMACGIGACLSCAVNTSAGYKRVCVDGPMFNSREIIWQK